MMHPPFQMRAISSRLTLHAYCAEPFAMSASLAYFDSYRSARLPQNLTQAQRDFFGAHTYQRVDRPDGAFVHTEWRSVIDQSAGGAAR